jgi:Sugar-transfer associated ATP-grasp
MIKNVIINLVNRSLYIKSEFSWNRKIDEIYKHLKIKKQSFDPALISKHKKYWGQLKKNVNSKWFEVYTHITGNPDIYYVPENIYHNIIEAKLNNRKLAYAYRDKNFYEIFYDRKDIFPEVPLRNINGFFYDKNYRLIKPDDIELHSILDQYNKLLIKPATESGGGKRIQLFQKEGNKFISNNGEELSIVYLKNGYRINYLVQNYIKQHSFFRQFNSSSVNTIRIFTYRSVLTDEIHVLHAVLRIGKPGNFIDDQGAGGIACFIDENAKLKNYATDKLGNKYYESNGIKFSNAEIVPKIGGMKEIAVYAAEKNFHSRLMGFDFCLDENENIKLIEINNQYAGINFFQMNAASVFGNYTDEIIEFLQKDKS